MANWYRNKIETFGRRENLIEFQLYMKSRKHHLTPIEKEDENEVKDFFTLFFQADEQSRIKAVEKRDRAKNAKKPDPYFFDGYWRMESTVWRYEHKINDARTLIKFKTRNYPALLWVYKVSKKFPLVMFEISFWDDPRALTVYHFSNGKIVSKIEKNMGLD